jgi:D-glycero-D-manno-heptose 1,7-bisphosphate phosphatase
MRAVFLDRDGVISENRPDHVKSWDEFQFIPGALSALRLLRQFGFRTFIVTNQAIVGRGIVPATTLDDIHARMLGAITASGGAITDLSYCPHDASEGCACRKPRPGMLQRLAARWGIALEQSYMIGDAWSDIEAGQAVGCRTVLVRTGRGADQIDTSRATMAASADHLAADLFRAVEWIVRSEGLRWSPIDRTQPAMTFRQALIAGSIKETWS